MTSGKCCVHVAPSNCMFSSSIPGAPFLRRKMYILPVRMSACENVPPPSAYSHVLGYSYGVLGMLEPRDLSEQTDHLWRSKQPFITSCLRLGAHWIVEELEIPPYSQLNQRVYKRLCLVPCVEKENRPHDTSPRSLQELPVTKGGHLVDARPSTGQTAVNKRAPIHYIIHINDMVHRPL